jgi:hypothetical protein
MLGDSRVGTERIVWVRHWQAQAGLLLELPEPGYLLADVSFGCDLCEPLPDLWGAVIIERGDDRPGELAAASLDAGSRMTSPLNSNLMDRAAGSRASSR